MLDQLDQFKGFFERVFDLSGVAEVLPAKGVWAGDLASLFNIFLRFFDALFGGECFCHVAIIA